MCNSSLAPAPKVTCEVKNRAQSEHRLKHFKTFQTPFTVLHRSILKSAFLTMNDSIRLHSKLIPFLHNTETSKVHLRASCDDSLIRSLAAGSLHYKEAVGSSVSSTDDSRKEVQPHHLYRITAYSLPILPHFICKLLPFTTVCTFCVFDIH